MNLKRVIVYKGRNSQTGTATQARFPGLPFEGKEESFEGIVNLTKNGPVLGILPIWNSHEGEIKKTGLFKELFEQNVKFEDIWPARIKFQCLGKNSAKGKKIKSMVSVFVAETQCSKFLSLLGKPRFLGKNSTPEAFEEFQHDTNMQAVLKVPGVFDKSKFFQIQKDASNPYNFTTFTLFGNVDSSKWRGKKWGALTWRLVPKENNLIGIEMPTPQPSLSDEQNELFDEIYGQSDHLDRLPRVIFIFDKNEVECGLLIEMSKKYVVSGPLQEDGSFTNIVVKRELGETKTIYKEEVFSFLRKEFSTALKGDFIKHIGTRTCFFACPTLNIMTHGFNAEIVEPVVRIIIFKYFQLIDNNLPCSAKQKALFNKHKRQYLKEGPKFIKFKAI